MPGDRNQPLLCSNEPQPFHISGRPEISAVLAVLFLCLTCLQSWPARAQSESSLAERIQKVISRPEFAHANFGIEFYSLDAGKVVYALNADKLFVPASTTKILTEGTLLATLGAGYRFHTRVYRTGPIDKHGTLKGDLILVASGDPNLRLDCHWKNEPLVVVGVLADQIDPPRSTDDANLATAPAELLG